jgi:hypothetical protein
MAKTKTTSARGNKRGSPEVVEKRKIARLFNSTLTGGAEAPELDGRTEKRRQRLLRELREGTKRGARALKPLEVMTRVNELLELGETPAAVRKVCKPARPIEVTDALTTLVKRLHAAYAFRPETYRFVGIEESVLVDAGVVAHEKSGRTRKKRAG